MGTSCLLTARVNGYSRVPDPPARMMPFMVRAAEHTTRPRGWRHAGRTQARRFGISGPACYSGDMARLALRLPENAAGEFYVDSSCIDCATCRNLAGGLFA